MSITDELREYAGSFYLFRYKDVREKLDAIADRIDAEHEKAIRELNDLADASVLLPVDANGEYIHVGDVMESRAGFDLFPQFEVRAMRYDGDEWEVFDRLGDSYEPSGLRHYHKPTVEDVLWKLLGDIRPDMEDEEALPIVAAYAKKLRLAEEKEQ